MWSMNVPNKETSTLDPNVSGSRRGRIGVLENGFDGIESEKSFNEAPAQSVRARVQPTATDFHSFVIGATKMNNLHQFFSGKQ